MKCANRQNGPETPFTRLTHAQQVLDASIQKEIERSVKVLRSAAANAALSDLAPYDHDHGTAHGKRHIQGGRSEVRTALYMTALSASRHNPAVSFFSRSGISWTTRPGF